MFLPVHAARRPPTLFAPTVFALAIPGVAFAIPGVALAIPGVALAIAAKVAFAIPIAIPPRTAEFRTLLVPFIAPPPRLFLLEFPLAPVEGFARAIAFLAKIIVAPKSALFAFAAKAPPLILILAGRPAFVERFSRPSFVPLRRSGTAVVSKGPVTPSTRRSVVFVVAAGHEGSFLNLKITTSRVIQAIRA
jgi:hypothetical protein